MPAVTRADSEEAVAKSEETRIRILDAAAHVLSIKGFAGTRLTDIVDITEIRPTAIYYHFPSRDDLFEEVMYRGLTEMRRRLEQTLSALPPDTAPMDRLMVAVEAHVRNELELSDYGSAWVRNSGQIAERQSRRLKKEETAYGQIWKDLFADAAAHGEINPALDARMARFLVIGAMNFATQWWDPRRGSVDTLVATAQLMVRNGLTPTI